MSRETKIEWCDSTFNPWIGCTKVSPACDHCYAAVSTPARALGVQWGAGKPRHRTSASNWKAPLRWNRIDGIKLRAWEEFKAQNPGLTDTELEARGFIKPRRRRVFCASLADVFDNEVPNEWRVDLLQLIADTPNLDWLLLTKRIGNAERLLDDALGILSHGLTRWRDVPWPNVWLGATICNQAEADRDIPKLLATPAAVRFLSMEPLLGRVDLSEHLGMWWNRTMGCFESLGARWNPRGLDWVIAGGESGHAARPMHPDWVRSLRDQCAAAGVPFLFKQWGEYAPNDRTMDAVRRSERKLVAVPMVPDLAYPAALVDRVGKKAAGRLLDGVRHNGFPEPCR